MFVALPESAAEAQVAVQRTRFELPFSNGYGAVLVDFSDDGRRVTQFREHLFAAEEPLLDANGDEVWDGGDFAAAYTRNILYDAYFGLRNGEGQAWLTSVPVDHDASGYAGWAPGEQGGTGVVQMVQQMGPLEATQYFFSPREVEHASFAMVMRVRNTSNATVEGAQAFSLHNFHLGYGRASSPWFVHEVIGNNGETLIVDGNHFIERGFAGVVVARALGNVAHFGTAPGADPFQIVASTDDDLPDNPPAMVAENDVLGSWQFDLGDLGPGEDAWVAVVVAHHGDPFADQDLLDALAVYTDAQTVLSEEIDAWAAFQQSVTLPDDLKAYEEPLLRHSAAMLRMGQVREESFYLREWLSEDGEVRRTRFPSKDAPAQLPGVVEHNGFGAVLASMPPGNWTYAWIRDGAYAVAGMAQLGMHQEARDALSFYLNAEAGRFQHWQELDGYDMPEYQISLVRYYGFGVEETDFNDYGPNLEFDGFGLFLWALRYYEHVTGDTTLADENWELVSTEVADVIVALIDPITGLLRPDSSIWETHWNGRERHWSYTNITAVRGLCDAAEMAQRVGDDARAVLYREVAEDLRDAIATRLTDAEGFIASNLEELEAGTGYYDAAVLDAIAMGLFDPAEKIATGTLAGMDQELLVAASGVGWARNDDRWDHQGSEDLSPWGSDYDSAEWVITDLRGAIATRMAGDDARSDAILQWVLAQSMENFLMVAETYDEVTGTYKFNHPMLGFGAGAFALAVAHREGMPLGPACGAYYEDEETGETGDEGDTEGDDETGGDPDTTTTGTDPSATATVDPSGPGGDDRGTSDGDEMELDPPLDGDAGGCGCRTTDDRGGLAVLGLLGLLGLLRRRSVAVTAAAMLTTACGDDERPSSDGTDGTDDSATTVPVTSAETTVHTTGLTTDDGDTTSDDTGEDDTTGGDDWGEEVDVCPVDFTFQLPGGASDPRIAGEWHGFDLGTATPMQNDGGVHVATIDLAPGLQAYKVVFDQGGETRWELDPGQTRRKYVDEIENSAVLVADCNLPRFEVLESLATRDAAGQGRYGALLEYVDGAQGSGAAADDYVAVLRHGGDERPLTLDELMIDQATGDVTLELEDLVDGKYTVVIEAATRSGKVSEPLRLVFWIEAEPFSWEDALIYMVLTDRYRDGEPGNNAGPTPMADERGDFWGGDLQGVRQSIESGLLDELGVRAIWLTPWQTNPTNAYLAGDGIHWVTGYHGYWPVKAREVDPRFGGEEALREMVEAAHAHGIRILQDYVINHVHEDHEYMQAHPEWFRTGCVCGTENCGWTTHALECLFTPYMPDINHTVSEANAQFIEDAVWWIDEFDLDGLRIDAVKHVEEAATRNLSAAVRETFEQAGTHYFLMGETAMGWNDCADPCNDENYGTIAHYVGPHGLDGQLDFVLYHGVSYRVFAYGDNGMLHADHWFSHGQTKWPQGSIMTPYIGDHDKPRFSTLAHYRGQDGAHDKGIAHNQFFDTAVAPSDGEPYRRTRIGMAWLMGLSGAPLLYYGDEYGQWGGADPNNRLMWRPEAELNAWEAETLAFVRDLGQARQQIRALRRGAYVSMSADEDTLVYGRLEAPGEAAIVALTRSLSDQQVTTSVVQLGFAPGTVLHDAMGGPDVTVTAGGQVTLDIPASGAVILAP
jgi:neopullulanase